MATGSQGQTWGRLTLLGVVGLVTWFSNPSLTTHRQTLRVELQQRVDRELARQGFWSGTLLWLTKDTTVETVVDKASYQNYGLASTTKYANKQLTFGICGRVFVVAEDHSGTPMSATKQP